MGCGQKKSLSYCSVAIPPASDRIPSQWLLVPSVMSVTSVANDRGDDETIRGEGAVLRSRAFYLAAEENPGKPQL